MNKDQVNQSRDAYLGKSTLYVIRYYKVTANNDCIYTLKIPDTCH